MEMPAVSASWIEQTKRYLATRFPARLYLPCAAFLASAGCAGGRALFPASLSHAWMLAMILLLQFRLMDDLADINHDRQVHPERVMAQATSILSFQILLGCSFLANCFLVAIQPGPEHRLGELLLLNAGAFLWYSRLRSMVTGRILGYHLVVGKYPAFVYLLSGNGRERWRLLLATSLVYICFSLYEALHDKSLHSLPGITTVRNVEIGALGAVSALMAVTVIGSSPSVVLFQSLLSAVVPLALFILFCHRQTHLSSPKTSYLVFVLGFIVILNFSFGVRL
jgi:hypothetical protein